MKKTQGSTPPALSVAAQIARLPTLSWPDLREEWQRLYDHAPPISNRRFVEKRIAYRLQEIAFRKVNPALLDSNQRRIDKLIAKGSLERKRVGALPVPGTELLRDYNGATHRVRVLANNQFEYQGQAFASLSPIARAITGTRWSGPAFFGLRAAVRNGAG